VARAHPKPRVLTTLNGAGILDAAAITFGVSGDDVLAGAGVLSAMCRRKWSPPPKPGNGCELGGRGFLGGGEILCWPPSKPQRSGKRPVVLGEDPLPFALLWFEAEDRSHSPRPRWLRFRTRQEAEVAREEAEAAEGDLEQSVRRLIINTQVRPQQPRGYDSDAFDAMLSQLNAERKRGAISRAMASDP
jgi:hypothetical protein